MMIKNFFKCGIAGWCMEVVWTSIMGIKNHDREMMGKTSIWMFPIYGLWTVIKPLSSNLRKFNMIFRGFIYMAGIYFVEFISGTILQRNNCCPWNYNKCKYNIRGVVRLDYAPLWFVAGLLLEKVVNRQEK